MAETMTDNLAAALAQLQANLPRITKGETAVVPTKAGGSYKYTYASLAHVSAEVLPLLGKLGLSWSTMPTLNEQGRFVLFYRLAHASGDVITGVSGEYPLPEHGTPQEMGSAITYARRYCLCAVTGVAPDDDDDDGAAATKAATARRQQKPAPKEEPPPVDEPDGLITPAQMRHMQALYGDMKITDRGNKLAYAIDVIGHPVESSKELTTAEAGEVIASLQRWKEQETPPPKDAAEVTS
jgi:hypothetical protein